VVRVPSDDHLLELDDGRTTGYATWGDPEGTPVFFAHGTPGSRRVLFPSLDDPVWLSQLRGCERQRGGSCAGARELQLLRGQPLATATHVLWQPARDQRRRRGRDARLGGRRVRTIQAVCARRRSGAFRPSQTGRHVARPAALYGLPVLQCYLPRKRRRLRFSDGPAVLISHWSLSPDSTMMLRTHALRTRRRSIAKPGRG
jgi:hypothetical protein